MTNTVPNVSRELLADLLGNDHDKRIMAERHLLAMLANAPSPAGVYSADPLACPGCASGCFRCASPAGVDGLEVVATLLIDDPTDQECGDWDIEVESKVAERMSEHGGGQHELCRLSDAQAIIDGLRGEVERYKTMSDNYCAIGMDANQRVGELEGLLRISSELLTTISAHAGTKPADWCATFKREVQGRIKRIDAALSAGKEKQDEHS